MEEFGLYPKSLGRLLNVLQSSDKVRFVFQKAYSGCRVVNNQEWTWADQLGGF